jgi:hypothetical protein
MDVKLVHTEWTLGTLQGRAQLRYLVSFARTFCTNFFVACDELDQFAPVLKPCANHAGTEYDVQSHCEACQFDHFEVEACLECRTLHDNYLAEKSTWRERFHVLHRSTLEMISKQWPELAEECQRQANERPIPGPIQF